MHKTTSVNEVLKRRQKVQKAHHVWFKVDEIKYFEFKRIKFGRDPKPFEGLGDTPIRAIVASVRCIHVIR